MNETRGTLEAASAPTAGDADFFPLNDLPNDVLVSVFEAVKDLRWVRHTVPCVCKEWDALYRSEAASPLHETLEVDFKKEVAAAGGRRDPVEGAPPRLPVVHASRVLSWAWRRAGWVRKLHLDAGYSGNFEEFTALDLGALVAVVGPSLTEISIHFGLGELCKKPFWRSLRTSVVPARRLCSLVVEDITSFLNKSDVEPLGQLAGSLEELVLQAELDPEFLNENSGLRRFPESVYELTELRRLVIAGHLRITAIPAGISSLKKLEDLNLCCCNLSSLPRELGELTALTKLDLHGNPNLGAALLEAEAFPAELGEMKSLRELDLGFCSLRSVPSFVCKLESLESLSLYNSDLSSLSKELGELSGLTKLDLSWNKSLGNTLPVEEAFPAELGKMKSLRWLHLPGCSLRTVPAFVGQLKSLESLTLQTNDLSSLPKELGELSGLTKLGIGFNKNLGNLPEDEAFPAELGKMKSLRWLNLSWSDLRTVPAFVSKLESLESLALFSNVLSSVPKELGELSGLTSLDLGWNSKLGSLPEDEAFPAELGKMTSLRELDLGFCNLSAVPSFAFELKSLEILILHSNDLSSLPKELVELSGLTSLNLGWNSKLGSLPEDEAFPAELGKMTSLRELNLRKCVLRTFPSFVGELKSLKTLDLRYNDDLQIDAPLDFLIERCPGLRKVWLHKERDAVAWTPEALAHLDAFKAKLRAKNPDAKVSYESGSGSEDEDESDEDE